MQTICSTGIRVSEIDEKRSLIVVKKVYFGIQPISPFIENPKCSIFNRFHYTPNIKIIAIACGGQIIV